MSYGELAEMSRVVAEEFTFEWRIPNFPSLHCTYSGNYYLSPECEFCDEKWWLKLWTNTKNENLNPKSGWVSIALIRKGPKPKHFHVSIGIRGSRGMEKKRESNKEFSFFDEVIYHFDQYCLRSELIRLMPDDVLTIMCIIKGPATARVSDIMQKSEPSMLKIGEDNESTLKEQAMDELRNSLKNLLKREEDCDVVIKVQDKKFRAHRLILQLRSPVFQAMFTHDMVEKQKGVVNMEDCDQDTFPDFLEHVYTGSIGMVSANNVFNLYAASEKYDLKLLKKACVEFIKKNLTVTSFCDAMTLAVKYGEKELLELATEFYCNNTLDIVKTPDWQVFLAENPTVGNELYIKQLTK